MMGRRDLGDVAAGRPELDRDHPGSGNDFQIHSLDLRFPFFQIVHLEADMVDAGPVAADLGIEGSRAFLVFDEGEIDAYIASWSMLNAMCVVIPEQIRSWSRGY